MLNPQNRWPFGLDQGYLPQFLAISGAIFVALLFLDAPVTRYVAQLPEAVRAPFYIITRAGRSDWNLVPALLVMLGAFLAARYGFRANAQARQKAQTIASVSAFVFAGVAGPGLLANLVKRLVGRARPVQFDEAGIFSFDPVVNDWTSQSFPSGDTTTIFAFALVVMFFWPRTAWLVLFGAVLVGLSRVMVGVHFPSDVFGGFLTGVIGAYGVRNYCLGRGWLFIRDGDGRIVPRLNWPKN